MTWTCREPLRPLLYDRLTELFGGEPEIVREGEEMDAVCVPSAESLSGFRLDFESCSWGETYRVCCPSCKDYKPRLFFGHRWGLFDERTRTRNWCLIKCHNEDCYASYERRMEMADLIFSPESVYTDGGLHSMAFAVDHGYSSVAGRGRGRKGRDVLLPGTPRVRQPQHIFLPGRCEPLDHLMSGHVARRYLETRGFDPDEIAEEYGVSYCGLAHDRYTVCSHRLVIPVYHPDDVHSLPVRQARPRLVGWQARRLSDGSPSYAEDSSGDRRRLPPKYYSAPGMPKGRLLYGFGRAVGSGSDYVVLCEGPTDVWRYGPEAVAAFGKGVSRRQTEMIVEAGCFESAVVLLDADAEKESVAAARKLRKLGLPRVVRVSLAEGKDPGSLTRRVLRRIVEQAITKSK